MEEIVVGDIGGTHARFAIARIENGRVIALDDETTLKCAAHASLELAWEAFGDQIGRKDTLPPRAGIAIASPVHGEVLRMSNNPWTIRRRDLEARLAPEGLVLVNDFGAVAHAVAHVGADQLQHLCGPDISLPVEGAISIVGPGTGLGAACLLRHGSAIDYTVLESEAGHSDFAPLDAFEDYALQHFRSRFMRVSTERFVSGPGLVNLYEVIAQQQGMPMTIRDDKELWTRALEGSETMAVAALERFCLCLGAFAGDLALAHGAAGMVIAGGLGLRLADRLASSGFAERFVAKGRLGTTLSTVPVKIITYPQPGLLGAAAAYISAQKRGNRMG